MKRSIKAITLILVLVAMLGILFVPKTASAAGVDEGTSIAKVTNENDVVVGKAVTAALVVAVVAAAGGYHGKQIGRFFSTSARNRRQIVHNDDAWLCIYRNSDHLLINRCYFHSIHSVILSV